MNYTQKLSKENGYSNIWLTPLNVFKKLDDEFKFDLDAATELNNPLNIKNFYTEEDNSLTKEWHGNVWLNPPYEKIDVWVQKAYNEFLRDKKRKIVMLIPSRTDTKYFHNIIIPNAEVRFVKGRLKFSSKGTAPFPSIVVVFGNTPNIRGFNV